MIYDLNKEESAMAGEKELYEIVPRSVRLKIKLILVAQSLGFMPKRFSKVKDMKRFLTIAGLCTLLKIWMILGGLLLQKISRG